jgi:hypothetical protein
MMAVEITAATAPGAAVQTQRSTEVMDVSDGTVLIVPAALAPRRSASSGSGSGGARLPVARCAGLAKKRPKKVRTGENEIKANPVPWVRRAKIHRACSA